MFQEIQLSDNNTKIIPKDPKILEINPADCTNKNELVGCTTKEELLLTELFIPTK